MYTQETPPEMPQNEQIEQVLTTVGAQTCLTKIVLNWSIILKSTNDQQLDFGIWIFQRYKSSYKNDEIRVNLAPHLDHHPSHRKTHEVVSLLKVVK